MDDPVVILGILVVGSIVIGLIIMAISASRRNHPPTPHTLQRPVNQPAPRREIPTPPPSVNLRFIVKDQRGRHKQPLQYGPNMAAFESVFGPRIPRPESIPARNKQQMCPICHQSINEGYANEGWARCQNGGGLVHGQCYKAYGRCKYCNRCHMSIEGRRNRISA